MDSSDSKQEQKKQLNICYITLSRTYAVKALPDSTTILASNRDSWLTVILEPSVKVELSKIGDGLSESLNVWTKN